MIEIPLTQGKIALIDDEDFVIVSKHKWYYAQESKNYGRAKTNIKKENGRGTTLKMHTLIMRPPKGFEVDHINHNPLDNRRSNLRVVTRSQNQKNMNKMSTNKSGYKGVSHHKKSNKWQVHIMNNGNRVYLGLFVDLKVAAEAYNKAALELYGEYASLNTLNT